MDQNVARRIQALKARLASVEPIWRGRIWTIYQGIDGMYVFADRIGKGYLLVAASGEIRDITGEAVDRADIAVVLGHFDSLKITHMAKQVRDWTTRRRLNG